jgi:hypothetical protein
MTGLALTAGLGMAGAQELVAEGRVIRGPYFDAGHRMLFAGHDHTFGTSRVAAMGGAFTSLGADLSSMSINPAGLGMYQSSDMGVTAALSLDRMSTTSPGMQPQNLKAGGNRTSFGLNNMGAAFNVFDSSGALTSVTLGFTYNRAANFNSRTRVNTYGEQATIADMFSKLLNLMLNEDMSPGALAPNARPFENLDVYLEEFGAVLGLHSGLVDLDGGAYASVPTDSYFGSLTTGGIYEYDFSMGVNLSNFIYLGATLGVTEINFSEETSYEEYYSAERSMWYDQSTNIMGNGYTAKLGLIARPVEALRIGVAFHLPTWYTLDSSWTGAMAAGSTRADAGAPLRDSHSFSTAPKLLTGISGVIARRAIVALDWEVDWYNVMRKKGGTTAESGNLYKPANTFRAGLEVIATDRISARAGGAYMMDFMRDPYALTNNPTAKSGYSITGGLGFKIGHNSYLDVAYVYNRARQTDYDLWLYDDDGLKGGYFTGQFDAGANGDIQRTYTPTRDRHMITLTLGNRF